MSAPGFCFAPRVSAVPHDPDVGILLTALAPRRGLCVLDSAGGEPRRASLVAFDPLERFSVAAESAAPDGPDAVAPRSAVRPGVWVESLRRFARRLERAPGDPVPGPFHGGLLAALAYDLGVEGERPVGVAPEPWGLPLCAAGLYVDFFVRDEVAGRTWLVLGEEPGDRRAPVEERRAELLALVARASGRLANREQAANRPRVSLAARGPLERCVPSAEHRRRIGETRRAIGRGDIYQANIAHRFLRRISGPPSELYARLRQVNPAPYMGYLEGASVASPDPPGLSGPGTPGPGTPGPGTPGPGTYGPGTREPDWAIASASPELLFEFDGRTARTRPIKGTIARSDDPLLDRRRRETLLASEKDRAELTMIVDLERNDLGRIARPGRVWVEHFPALQTYPALHHLVADVVCEPREDVDAWDVLAALFPGGSITGAPKLAAMDVIAELEQEGRGFFTGSLGFVDLRGHAQFNILIRTLLWRRASAAASAGGLGPRDDPGAGGRESAGEVSFRVGGGITWGSDPAAEEHETLVKAERLVAALELEPPERGDGDAA